MTRPWVYDRLHNRLGGRIGLLELDDLEGVDIDTELDFALAEQQMDQYLAVQKVLQHRPGPVPRTPLRPHHRPEPHPRRRAVIIERRLTPTSSSRGLAPGRPAEDDRQPRAHRVRRGLPTASSSAP